MNNANIKPSKAMGQNFLNDANIARKIVKLSGVDKTCGVIEVGPGGGALTVPLAHAAGHVVAVELDRRLVEGVRGVLKAYSNVTIIQGDILKQELAELVSDTLPEERRIVCANLPYNITTPAITKFIEAGVFDEIIVMVQKEVAMRMCATPGTADYGAFTVFVSYHCLTEILFDVPQECFSPRPRVMSSVIRLTVRKEPLLPFDKEKKLFRTVRAAFGQRRKTLVNALYAAFKSTHDKEAIAKAVERCGFDARIRGEALSLEEFIRLSEELCTASLSLLR